MRVLGIHIGHDSSAALVEDGRIVADVAEERFTRTKHYAGLPIHSLAYCLDAADISIEEVDLVAIPSIGPYAPLNHLLDLNGKRALKPSMGGRLLQQARKVMKASMSYPPLYIRQFPLPPSTEIVQVEHHVAHAASAYYTSGTLEAQLVVTMDSVGDGYSTCVWRGEGGRLEPLMKVGTEGSIGWFYSNVTEALGWWHGDGEGKTMGLAPYGDYTKIEGILDRFHPRYQGGSVVAAHNYGQQYYWNESGAIEWHCDQAYEIRDLIESHGREDIAAEAQRVLEEQVLEVVIPWLDKTGLDRLSCAGGLFLNVKANQHTWESGRLQSHHIYPNAGDSGLAAGAALHAYYQANPGSPVHELDHVYLGPSYEDAEIEDTVRARGLPYRQTDDPAGEAARFLADGRIVAWFQGGMESGPRSLGARAILMSAGRSENKDVLNARVKFREPFRPFCPSILDDVKGDYLENARNEEFMITSFNATPDKRGSVPAVVHVDGTLRPQTVRRKANPLYWKLIKDFGDLTGDYLVLNTSLNIRGEPIINSPGEAIRCFYDTGIDAMVIGSFILEKSGIGAR